MATRLCAGVNQPVTVCWSERKRKDAVSWCKGTQDGCEPLSGSTFYTNCGGFNIGCYIYEYIGGEYKSVKDGFYSNGTYVYYVENGITVAPEYECPRFFELDWIKDCLSQNNLSGTYYFSVVDDNTWVPDPNVVYRIYMPLRADTNCNEVFSTDYYAVKFLNTTPTFDIGNSSYMTALKDEMLLTYETPSFLQNRCYTKQIT